MMPINVAQALSRSALRPPLSTLPPASFLATVSHLPSKPICQLSLAFLNTYEVLATYQMLLSRP